MLCRRHRSRSKRRSDFANRGIGGKSKSAQKGINNESPTKIKEQLAKPDEAELRDSEWVTLYRDVVNRGVIKTIGTQKAEEALTSVGSKKALALLKKEELLCQRAGYEAGLAHCASKKAVAFVELNLHRKALDCVTEAAAIWRRVGNRTMLARSLFAESFLLFGENFLNKPNQQTTEAKLNQLQEMWDAGRGPLDN